MDTIYLSNVYYKDMFINSISNYFKIDINNIKLAELGMRDQGNNVSKVTLSRSYLIEKYKQINNISEFSHLVEKKDVKIILDMVTSNDEETIKLGLDLFLKSSIIIYDIDTANLMSFLNRVSNVAEGFFKDRYNSHLYITSRYSDYDRFLFMNSKIVSIMKNTF